MSKFVPVLYSAATAAWLAAIRQHGEIAVLGGNVVWYGLAVLYFGFLNHKSVLWMIPRKEWSNPLLTKSLASSMGFLGGMNMALVTLSAFMIVARRRTV